MFRVDIGDDIFGLYGQKVIGYGGKIPTLIANVPGIARAREDGGIIFEPDYLPDTGAALDMNWNESSGWILPGVSMISFSDGRKI